MARIRSVKPEFYSDPDLGRLSLEARYLYKGSWSFADDEGRIPADARLFKSQVFPFDDKITVRKVERLLTELEKAGKTVPYEVDGVQYLDLPNFRKHQKINKPQPAKYPPPGTEGSLPSEEDSRNGNDESGNENGTVYPLSDTTRPDQDSTLGDSKTPNPAERGEETKPKNPRANGTSPRQIAAKDRYEAILFDIEECFDCDAPAFICGRHDKRLASAKSDLAKVGLPGWEPERVS